MKAAISKAWKASCAGALASLVLASCTGSIRGAGDALAAGGSGGAAGSDPSGGASAAGAIGRPGGAGGASGAGSAGQGASGAAACTSPGVGAAVPVRRLTVPELVATVSDVLGVDIDYAVADETLIGYRANTSSALDTTTARVLLTTAEQIASAAVPALIADPRCAADCESVLLDDVGTRLFRRPLDAETRARFAALYAQGVAAEGASGGARWLLEGMLQSARFLYQVEATDSGGRLDGYAIASRLSYALWKGPPDGPLLDAAARGELASAAGIAAAAERMIDDPRLERGLGDFTRQWLGLEHLDDASSRPDVAALDADTRAALAREPVAVLAAHVRRGSTLAEVLRATETIAEPALDEIYGADVLSVTGERAQLDPAKRAGLLALPGVLAALSHAEQTSPTLRGRAVLANLLCRPPAPPPANVNPTLPPSMPGATTRERLQAHFTDPECAGCHASMDGIGFAFERFDWLGKSRELDNGRAIDSSADFTIGSDPISVSGAPDLASALAERSDVAECFARHFSRYALGVRETDDFACTVEALAEAAQGALGLRGMLIAYLTSPWFIAAARAPEMEEM